MAKNSIPQHPQGWRFCGRAGTFHVWHGGPNEYRVTEGPTGEVLHQCEQLAIAFGKAQHCYHLRECQSVPQPKKSHLRPGSASDPDTKSLP